MTHNKEEADLSEEDYWRDIDVNDCGYLLRTLEREAYTGVVNALRAKGPPSDHTFILLDHLRSALSINDELGRAEIRRASSDAKLSKVASVLNPSYDTTTEWAVCSVEARGAVEAGPSKARPFSQTTSITFADQLLSLASGHNDKVAKLKGRAVELLAIPPRPFVPERLRLLLRETDRPEERIVPPLEPLPTPLPPQSVKVESEECKPPPPKKRRQRQSKAMKEQPPQLHPELAASTSSPIAAAASVASGSNASISPGQPPQHPDQFKAWVSKIHDQEVARGKNGMPPSTGAAAAAAPSPHDDSLPSTSAAAAGSASSAPAAPPAEESAKRKRRQRARPPTPEHIATCARNRPWDFEKAVPGKPKPPRGNPDKTEAKTPGSGKRSSPGVYGGSYTAAVMAGTTMAAAAAASAAGGSGSAAGPSTSSSIYPSSSTSTTTPLARPSFPSDHAGYGSRNGLMDSPMGASTSAGTSVAAGGGGGGGYGMGRAIGVPGGPHVVKRATPTMVRTQARHYVANTIPSGSAGPTIVKSTGMAGRGGSLGNQQQLHHGLSSGMSFSAASQRATMSASNTSIHSSGSGGGGGGTAEPAQPAQPISALPPEEYGHDYGVTMPPPNTLPSTAAGGSTTTALAATVQWGGPRNPRVLPPRTRMANPAVLRSPASVSTLPRTSPQHFGPTGNPLPSPSPSSLHPNPSPSSSISGSPQLQRAGSVTSIRPRSASRGGGSSGSTTSAAAAANAAVASAAAFQATYGGITVSQHLRRQAEQQQQVAGGGQPQQLQQTPQRVQLQQQQTQIAMQQQQQQMSSGHRDIPDFERDANVQNMVHSIMLEAKAKETANGRRANPRERDNGSQPMVTAAAASTSSAASLPPSLPSQPPAPLPPPPATSSSQQQQQQFAVCRTTADVDSSEAAAAAAIAAVVASPSTSNSFQGDTMDPRHLSSPSMGTPSSIQSSFSSTPLLSAITASTSAPAPPSTLNQSAMAAAAAVAARAAAGGSPLSGLFFGPSPSTAPLQHSPLAAMSHLTNPPPIMQPMQPFLHDPAMMETIKNLIAAGRQQPSVPAAAAAPAATPSPFLNVNVSGMGASSSAAAASSSTLSPVVQQQGGGSSKPTPRTFMLKPEGSSFMEFSPQNPNSFKSFASDGTPLQYGVSAEELYDGGGGRPSTSGIGGGSGGRNARVEQQLPPPPSVMDVLHQLQQAHNLQQAQQMQQQAAALAAALSSANFTLPSTSAAAAAVAAAATGGIQSQAEVAAPLPPSAAAAAAPPPTAPLPPPPAGAGEVRDILEQSCLELQ